MNYLKSLLSLSFIFNLFLPTISLANTYLKPGEITFLTINTKINTQTKEWCKNQSSFDFVLLQNLKENTKIYFTNNGWDAKNNFWHKDIFKGTIAYTAPNDINKGDIIHFDDCALKEFPKIWNSVGMPMGNKNNFKLESENDRIIAFQGNYINPEFIAAVAWKNFSGWSSIKKNQKGSDIPTGLSFQKKNIFTLKGSSNFQYDCSFSQLKDNYIFLENLVQENRWKLQENSFAKSNCNINKSPTDIKISSETFESGITGRIIATLNAEDSDSNEKHNFQFCSAADNAKFRINGNSIVTNQNFDFESPNDKNQDYSFEICIKVLDKAQNQFDKNFSLKLRRKSDINSNELKPISLSISELNDKQKNLQKAEENSTINQGRDSKVIYYQAKNGKDKFIGYIPGKISQEKIAEKSRDKNTSRWRDTKNNKNSIIYKKKLHITRDLEEIKKLSINLKNIQKTLNNVQKELKREHKKRGIKNSKYSSITSAERVRKVREFKAKNGLNIQRYTGESLQTKNFSRLKKVNTIGFEDIKIKRKSGILRNTKFKKKNNLDKLKKRRDKKDKEEEKNKISYIRIRGSRELEDLHESEILA